MVGVGLSPKSYEEFNSRQPETTTLYIERFHSILLLENIRNDFTLKEEK